MSEESKGSPEEETRNSKKPITDTFSVVSERVEEVDLYKLLPHSETFGTSYYYLQEYPNMFTEFYFLLECATLNNADPEAVVKMCQEIVEKRNSELLDNFGKGCSEIDIDKISYECTNLSIQPICDDEDERE